MRARPIVAAAALVAVVVSSAITGPAAGAAPAQAAPAKDPVIVVNGLFGVGIAYAPLVARLRADGYRTWDFELPTLGTQDIRRSAEALAAFADGVRAQTGAAKVDLVAHSEGGLVSRAYVKWYGGAAEVDSLITLGTPNYGTVAANIIRVFTLGTCVGVTACEQMTIGSSFLADLNAGDDSIGAVTYTNLVTVFDEPVAPVPVLGPGGGPSRAHRGRRRLQRGGRRAGEAVDRLRLLGPVGPGDACRVRCPAGAPP